MSELVSYNPATGEAVGSVPVTAASDIPAIVEAARVSAAGWRAMPISERGELLKKAGKQLVVRAKELGYELSREMGKPLKAGIGEVKSCGFTMSSMVDEAIEGLASRTTEKSGVRTTIAYDAYGVCGVITPWNFPISMPHWTVIPALMAGNAVVLKPSEETPLIAQAYVDLLNKELPEGVLRIVHGADDQGKALVASDVNMITFTGSREVGIKIMAAAAPKLKRLVLELGGKDPLIVLKGADLDNATKFAVRNSFDNSGQACISTERILVHSSEAADLEARIAQKAAQWLAGPFDEEGVRIGPMIHETQRSHVIAQIRDAVAKGARVLCGGVDHPDRYVNPTVLAGVTPEMAIFTDETFGPVACITTFEDDQEALDLANSGPYGLGGVVYGEPEHALRVGRGLDVGMLGVNQSIFGVGPKPWVGAKQSGFGFHGSPEGCRQFAQIRVISEALS